MVALIATTHARVDIVRGSTVTWNDEGATFQVRVEPNERNRMLNVWAVDSDGFQVQFSHEPLDGENARITRWVTWRHVPAEGDVVVIAALYESGDKPVATDHWRMQVLARH